jgi:hypothetical protein
MLVVTIVAIYLLLVLGLLSILRCSRAGREAGDRAARLERNPVEFMDLWEEVVEFRELAERLRGPGEPGPPVEVLARHLPLLLGYRDEARKRERNES